MSGAVVDPSIRLRSRARLLEFLKFRVLASQEAFFDAWLLAPADSPDLNPLPCCSGLPALDLSAFRGWLQPLWPEVSGLSDDDLSHCLEQAYRLYVDPPRCGSR
jgi:hypothetical protein